MPVAPKGKLWESLGAGASYRTGDSRGMGAGAGEKWGQHCDGEGIQQQVPVMEWAQGLSNRGQQWQAFQRGRS